MLRIPDQALDCVGFLAVERNGNYRYAGTGFFVSLPGPHDKYFPYFITARHNIEMAKRESGRLVARFNDREGAHIVDISGVDIIVSDDAGVDVALIEQLDWTRLIEQGQMRHLPLPDMAATADYIRDRDLGIGSEVFVTGLFAVRRGQSRNLPIGRTGTISAMPLELDEDEWSGKPYQAYLVELRSLGGLSGSPVFVLDPPTFKRNDSGNEAYLDQALRLLGMVRGHWNYRPESTAVDFDEREAELVHSGIAIVTPVDEILRLLQRDDLEEERRRRIRQAQ